jgi:hypothetical protein
VTEVADVGAVKVRALLAEYLRHASVASSRPTPL